MARTPTAERIFETLPHYYWGEPLIERIVQARANEFDRLDAQIDRVMTNLVPGSATDEFGLLAAWERHLDLPAAPTGLSESQRQARLIGALSSIGAHTSADVLATLSLIAGQPVVVLRDTPTPLTDTIVTTLLPGSSAAGYLERTARKRWPAHRGLQIRFEDGFVLDISRLDVDSF